MRDWTGNRTTSIVTTGGHNYSKHDREQHDFYATDPKAIDLLLPYEKLSPCIWECACGMGHLSKRLKLYGYNVYSTDLINRNYGISGIDFLQCTEKFNGTILTNPPFKYAEQFINKGLELAKDKVIMLLRIQFLEGINRYKTLFTKTPPARIYVFSSRLGCWLNGVKGSHSTSAIAYAWFVWDVGHYGETKLNWLMENKELEI